MIEHSFENVKQSLLMAQKKIKFLRKPGYLILICIYFAFIARFIIL